MKKIILLLLIFLYSCTSSTNTKSKDLIQINDAIVFVELAETEVQRATGLMFRETMQSNHGMLFIFDKPLIPSFYMKDTKIPLDIIFIDKKHKIVSIQQMQPFDETNLHSPPVPIIWALEANQNWCQQHNIKLNDKVVLKRSPK